MTPVTFCSALVAAAATLPPLPAFRVVPHLDATEVRKGDLSLVTMRAYGREGTPATEANGWVKVVPRGSAPCSIVGVGRVGDAVADLVATNAVRLERGAALVAVKRPPQGHGRITRLAFVPEGDDLVGLDVWLRTARDVKGVWRRSATGGASQEVPADSVTNDFEIATSCDKVYNLFDDPTEPLRLDVRYVCTAKAPRRVRLGCRAYDWDGRLVVDEASEAVCRPGDTRCGKVSFEPREKRGLYFVEPFVADAETGRELAFARTHLARLPPHDFKSTPDDSVFGLASFWDAPTHEDAERLMDRLGVRWTRIGDARAQRPSRAVNYHNNHGNWKSCLWPEASRDGWVRAQCAYCAEHGAKYFEFGNEMNLSVATIGEATDGIGRCHFADAYVSWVKTFDRVMKREGYDTRVNLLGFGMAGFDHAFATRMREGGILPMLKGFCIHPPTSQFTPDYPYEPGGDYGPPERALGPHPGDYPTPGSEKGMYWNYLGSIRAARAFLDKYAPQLPLWVTELYSSSLPNFVWGPSMRDGADNVVLEYALLKAEGVKAGFYYMLCDGIGSDRYGINPKNREYTFGLLNRDLSLKPAALAYCAIAEALDQAAFKGWLKMADPKTHGLLFATPRGPMAVLWARWDGLFVSWNDRDGVCRDREPWQNRWPTRRAVSLPAHGPVTRIDEIGRAQAVDARDGSAAVALSGSPCIVYGLDPTRLTVY